MPGRCPHCDTVITAVTIRGPGRVNLSPCGHQVHEADLDDVDWRDRRAEVQERDGDLYIADGGGYYCDECGDRLASDAEYGWMCLSCGEPRDGPDREDDLRPDGGHPPCDRCEHPLKSHRYGGANAHGSFTYLSSCRRCSCDQYTHPEKGELRRDPGGFRFDGGQPAQQPVSDDDDVLEAVARRGERYVIFELLGRTEDLFMGVQDLRVNDDVEQVDVDSPLEDVVDELEHRVDNLVRDREHAWEIAEGRVDRARVDVAMDRWGADDE